MLQAPILAPRHVSPWFGLKAKSLALALALNVKSLALAFALQVKSLLTSLATPPCV